MGRAIARLVGIPFRKCLWHLPDPLYFCGLVSILAIELPSACGDKILYHFCPLPCAELAADLFDPEKQAYQEISLSRRPVLAKRIVISAKWSILQESYLY